MSPESLQLASSSWPPSTDDQGGCKTIRYDFVLGQDSYGRVLGDSKMNCNENFVEFLLIIKKGLGFRLRRLKELLRYLLGRDPVICK